MVLVYYHHAQQRCRSGKLPLSIRLRKKPLFATILLTFALSAVFLFSSSDIHPQSVEDVDEMDFDDFNNETGASSYIVPNIIHYVRFNMTEYSFVDYLCLRAAFLRQRPDYVYIHTDVPHPGNGGFRGKYWDMIKMNKKLMSSIRFLRIELASEIFGQPLSRDWRVYHGSDIARIRTMMKYGGIYLDNDVYVVQNLDKYRKYEIAMGWDEGQFLGSQVIVAHRNARFLPLWLDTYRQYHADLWYYNAGERPTTEILHKQPELIHRVKWRFGVHMLMQELYDSMDWPDWQQNQDTIHLLINHRSYLDPHFKEYSDFNERNIRHYPYMFGELARLVMPDRSPATSTTSPSSISDSVLLDWETNLMILDDGEQVRPPDPTED